MIEDMTIRKFAQKTQHDYVQRVKKFAAFLGRSPATAKLEDVRRYRLHLASSGAGTPPPTCSASALRVGAAEKQLALPPGLGLTGPNRPEMPMARLAPVKSQRGRRE